MIWYHYIPPAAVLFLPLFVVLVFGARSESVCGSPPSWSSIVISASLFRSSSSLACISRQSASEQRRSGTLSLALCPQSDGGNHRWLPLVSTGCTKRHLLAGARDRGDRRDRPGRIGYLVFQKDGTNFCRCNMRTEEAPSSLAMSEPAITIENLGKRYTIGHQRAKGDGMRHSIESAIGRRSAGFDPAGKKGAAGRFLGAKRCFFSDQQGEVVGIIGRNGAGKSTLLKILSRITVPTEGRIRIDGRIASLLEVGTGFHQELTGRENIFLNGAILGMTRAEIVRKFDEIVEFSGIEEFLDTPVKRYSSGMYVRLASRWPLTLNPKS